jgi:hypothetical protein
MYPVTTRLQVSQGMRLELVNGASGGQFCTEFNGDRK